MVKTKHLMAITFYSIAIKEPGIESNIQLGKLVALLDRIVPVELCQTVFEDLRDIKVPMT